MLSKFLEFTFTLKISILKKKRKLFQNLGIYIYFLVHLGYFKNGLKNLSTKCKKIYFSRKISRLATTFFIRKNVSPVTIPNYNTT